MDFKKEIEKLHSDINISVGDEFIEVYHPSAGVDLVFDRHSGDKVTLNAILRFLEYECIEGISIQRKNYYEVVISVKNYIRYEYEDQLEVPAAGYNEDKIYYEIGAISDDFEKILNETISWDNFSTEYFISLKIFNMDIQLNLKKETNKTLIYEKLVNSIFFDLHHNFSLQIEITDLADYKKYDLYHNEETEIEPIEDTAIDYNKYDKDLISYYNRATRMAESEFQYLAYFQVLECIFDEVYKYETIQDIKTILNSNWFSNSSNENINSLIDVVDKYNKEKNDRNKTKIVLEKYFKKDVHDDAYFLANKEIIQLLTEMKLIKSKTDLNDLQKISNIIYDYRCECTHSNRLYPIKNSTVIEGNNLKSYIELIRKISERIILNYN